MQTTGYLNIAYPLSVAGPANASNSGIVIYTKDSGLGLIERKIPNSIYSDAVSPYPYFMSRTPAKELKENIKELCQKKGLISATLISAPLQNQDLEEHLPWYTQDNIYIVNLGKWSFRTLDDSYFKEYKENLGKFYFDVCSGYSLHHASALTTLYPEQIERHKKKGSPRDLSIPALVNQMRIPGFFSILGGFEKAEGIFTFYRIGEDIYTHLSGVSSAGYSKGVHLKLLIEAILFFKNAGFDRLFLSADPPELHTIKKRISNASAFNKRFCYVADKERYNQLIRTSNVETQTFPRYRQAV